MKKRLLALALCALLLIAAFPLAASAAAGEKDNLILLPPDAASLNESWLEHNFPKLRSMETTQTRFVFASAPKVT